MKFSGTRLRIARLFHGLTQRELASQIAVSNGLIAAIENGDKQPGEDILRALCVVLEIEPEYFTSDRTDEFLETESNFRKRISAPDRLKKQVLARASMFGMAVQYLGQFGIFPKFDFPDLPAESNEDIERIAEQCRNHWRLGIDAPIGDMARVIENAGAVILSVDLATAERVDAFSRFGQVSVVVLNGEKQSPSRTLFDMAHETGHGVLHQSPRGLSLEQKEAQADYFAGAFLLPREAFASDFTANRALGWEGLIDMKRYWRTSIQAILHRAYQLNLIDAAEYRTRFRTLSGWGWRKEEPEEPTVDHPSLFQAALDHAFANKGKTPADIAFDLGWSKEMFEKATGVPVPAGVIGKVIPLDRRRVGHA